MVETILVAYATRYGSTQEVAEQVATILRESGLPVEVRPTGQVRDLTGYRAVVLGAPLYIGRWLKDAHRFLGRHQAALGQRPVAVFALGPTRESTEADIAGIRASLDKELAVYPWLKPVAVALFGGKYDPAKLRFPDSLLSALPASPLHNAPVSDARDWNAIRAWAQSIVPLLVA